MCVLCSRRDLISGAIATLLLSTEFSYAGNGDRRVLCGFNNDDLRTYHNSMTSTSGDPRFDSALIAELKRILQVIPIDPGFKYVKANNAAASDESIVHGTKGTVFIGLDFVRKLVDHDDGGVSVAGVLAHECAHIYQYFSPYNDELKGSTYLWFELHADLLAGYYMAKKLGTDTLRLSEFQRTLIRSGTYNEQDLRNHGTPGQRNAAMDKGYRLSRSGMTFEDAAREGKEYVQRL
jgi:hypothetical protein